MMRHGEESQSTPHLAADRAEGKNQPTAAAYDARDSRQRLDGAILDRLIMPHLAYLAVVTLLFGPLYQSADGPDYAFLALAFIIRPLLGITVVFATRCLQEQGKGLGYDFKGLHNPVILGLALAVWYWIHFWVHFWMGSDLAYAPGYPVVDPGFVLLDFGIPVLVLGGWFAWRTRVIKSSRMTDAVVKIHWLSHLMISAILVVVIYAVLIVLVPM